LQLTLKKNKKQKTKNKKQKKPKQTKQKTKKSFTLRRVLQFMTFIIGKENKNMNEIKIFH
jgi:chromosomal replication initiation ATPase DnaA